MRRLIIPLAAAFTLALGTATAGAEEPLDTLAVQSAYQSSLTEQAALALAGADGSTPLSAGDALATNLSRTLQVIHQIQRGCRAYCFGDKMEQKAWQAALTLQDAKASGDNSAAINLSETLQMIEQIQKGCRIFCYGITMSQWAAQGAGTYQDAEARAEGDSAEALAANLSITTQLIRQIQEACQKHCFGIELSQTAWQSAATGQHGLAIADGGSSEAALLAASGLEGDMSGQLVSSQAITDNLAETQQLLEQIQSDCRRYCYEGVSLTDVDWWARMGLAPVDVDPLDEHLFADDDVQEALGLPLVDEGVGPADEGVAPADEGIAPADEGAGEVEAADIVAPVAAETTNDSTTEQALEQLQR